MSIHRNARVVSMIAVLVALLTATAAFAEEGAFDDPPADQPTCEEVIVDDGGSTEEGSTDPRGGSEEPAEEARRVRGPGRG